MNILQLITEFLMEYNTALNYFTLAYHPFLIVFILYVAFITASACEEDHQSAFFRIYSSILCSEFLYILSKDVLILEELFHFFTNVPIIILSAVYLSYTAMNGMVIGYTIIALNRFTAVITPGKYAQIWDRTNLRLMLAFQQIIPLFIFSPIYLASVLYENGIYTGITVAIGSAARWTIAGLFALSAFVCLLLNTVTVLKIHKANHRNRNERKLLKIALLTFIMHCLLTALNGWRAISIVMTDVFQKKLTQKMVFIFSDVNALVTCAAMFIANSRLKQLFGIRRRRTGRTSTTTTTHVCERAMHTMTHHQ